VIHDKWQAAKYIFGGWAGITIVISIVDIILTGLIAHDYDYLVKYDLSQIPEAEPEKILVSYGIIMSMAARGYILWILNVILAVILIKFTGDLVKSEKSTEPSMPIIHGYETANVNPPWYNGSMKDLWASSEPETPKSIGGFTNHGFERSQSFFPAVTPEEKGLYMIPYVNSSVFPSNTNNATTVPKSNSDLGFPKNTFNPPNSVLPTKIAKIGKQGRRSPPNNISPSVVIPEPDYTPPSTPTGLKSVLRSKSNYY